MCHDPCKLFELLPDDISDEAAFMLSGFIEDLNMLIESYYGHKIRRYITESRQVTINEDIELDDPPF